MKPSRLPFSIALTALSRAVAAVLLLGLMLGFPPSANADDIRLGLTKGDVQILSAGHARPTLARTGQALRVGDRIYTGRDGWTVMMMPDGSRVVLIANSEFMVRSHDAKRRRGTFALLSGMLRALITPSPKEPPNYRFNTLTAVAGVRGTDFTIINRGQANVFFGNKGKVEVQGLNTEIRPLTAGTVVQTTRGAVPTQPISVEPNSSLAEAQALLNAVTEQAPESWIETGKLPEIVARWNITYSRYLADAGRSEEALHVLQLAIDLTDAQDIQADARLERGAVFSRDPSKASLALQEYQTLLDSPVQGPQRESALYMMGLAHYQLRQQGEARTRLQQYRHDYPEGRFKERVETLLRSIEGSAP